MEENSFFFKLNSHSFPSEVKVTTLIENVIKILYIPQNSP